jgi:hypothetical protein
MTPAQRYELQLIAQHIWAIGPRAVAEAIEAVGDDRLLAVLRPYMALTPDMLRAAGATGFPPPPPDDQS